MSAPSGMASALSESSAPSLRVFSYHVLSDQPISDQPISLHVFSSHATFELAVPYHATSSNVPLLTKPRSAAFGFGGDAYVVAARTSISPKPAAAPVSGRRLAVTMSAPLT